MQSGRQTQDDRDISPRAPDAPVPGVLLVFTGGQPILRCIPLRHGSVFLGRDDAGGEPLPDERCSRVHAEIRYDGLRWSVRDLDSRNGTFVDARQIAGTVVGEGLKTVRLGQSIFLLRADVRRFEGAAIERLAGMVIGPQLRAALDAVRRAALSGETLLINGESGTGKELAARTYHEAGSHAAGPFVAVNCAAIPEGVAERLLFGARRGAFSGATADADGYLQAADGGTLFLDEIAELDPNVQAKLLRVLETREVMPLGAARPRPVDLRICAATHRDLRAAVAEGAFRQDLYFRIGRPAVNIVPLRERGEEMPWLIAQELGKLSPELTAQGRLVETCVGRPWPGNIRELAAEVRRAGQEALAAGSVTVGPEHLGDTAGQSFGAPAEERHAREDAGSGSSSGSGSRSGMPSREDVEAALARDNGNVAAAARGLGLHRTQLYRILKRYGITLSREPE